MKPLLSAKLDDKFEYKFPYLASPKLDGIRCLIIDGVAVSRTLKPIPNKHIQSILGNPLLNNLDGEIIVGSPGSAKAFQETTTIVMSHDKVSDFTFYVFDDFTEADKPFADRLNTASKKVTDAQSSVDDYMSKIEIVHHTAIPNIGSLAEYESETLAQGYEGVMLRKFDGAYKFGRSTAKEQILVKVKRFTDDEAVVTGFVELMHNDNEATTDNLGHTKRSTHKDGKRPANTLGALIVKNSAGVEFEIGTGFTANDRQAIWNNQGKYLGQTLTYKHFEHGAKDKPRHPVFKGWRWVDDVA